MSDPGLRPLVNWSRLQALLASQRVDLVIATTNVNVTYLTDFWSLSQWSRRTAQVFGIAGRTQEREVDVVMPLGAADLTSAPGRVRPTRSWTYGDFYCAGLDLNALGEEERAFRQTFVESERHKSAIDALVAAIEARGRDIWHVALEAGGLPDGAWNAIAERLPHVALVPAERLLREVRSVKSPRELELLRCAAQTTEAAFLEVASSVGEGASELDVQRSLHRSFIERGGLPFLTSVSGGKRTALPNGQATTYRLQRGDLLRFDGGCRFQLYASDIGRIGIVGSPTGKQRDYYRAVREGTEAAIAQVRPGVTCGELFDTAVKQVRRSAIAHYERSHCGHGIGIENYDLPHITAGSSETLEAGMVICVETPYYELGWGGVQAEDTLAVTESGCDRFTDQPADLVPCG
jgi:Xaa-Pro dipeptidase